MEIGCTKCKFKGFFGGGVVVKKLPEREFEKVIKLGS